MTLFAEIRINKQSNLICVPENSLRILSLKEVSVHDEITDCWIIVFDYVYDVTKFLQTHPGGEEVLLEYAGRDATIAFDSTGHSKAAYKLLKQYEIGQLPIHERLYKLK